MKRMFFLLMAAISLVSCRTSKVSSDATARSTESNATVTSESTCLSSIVDSLKSVADVSIDSIVITYQDTDCAENTSGDPGRSDGTDLLFQNPCYPDKKAMPQSMVIYGLNAKKVSSRISNAQQIGIEKDSMNRFQHHTDSTMHSETRHPPNRGTKRILWSLFALAFTLFLLWRAEK